MSQLSKIHLIHTTAGSSYSDTDGSISFRISVGGNTHTFPANDLPHDEREKRKTDHYKFDVLSLNIDDGASINYDLKTTSRDGWLPRSVYVIGQNVDGQCKLLAAKPSWSGWLDKDSVTTRPIPTDKVTNGSITFDEVFLLQTTSGSSGADSDGAFYLDIQQETDHESHRLDTSNNDFYKKRSEEYPLSLAKTYNSEHKSLRLHLRTTSTDGWLPEDVFVIGKGNDGNLKLLVGAPSWSSSLIVDAPHRGLVPLESTYSDTHWRENLEIDEDIYYTLKVQHDNWYLGIEGGGFLPDHVELIQDEARGACHWQFKKLENDRYILLDRLSGKALRSNGLTDDQLDTQYAPSANGDCHFTPLRDSNGKYTIRLADNSDYGIALRGSVKKGTRFVLSTSPTQFDLIPARKYKNPECSGVMVGSEMNPVAEFVLTITRDGISEIIDSKAPGGGTVFSMVFDDLLGMGGPSIEDLFDKFREDLMREINAMMANAARREAVNTLETSKTEFLLDYMSQRKAQVDEINDLPSLANVAHRIAQDTSTEMARLLPTFNGFTLENSAGNITLCRAVFPIYVLGAIQAVSAYQEAAYIAAYEAGWQVEAEISGATEDDYAFRVETLSRMCATFKEKIEVMYAGIWTDRISEITKHTEYENLNTGLQNIQIPIGKYWQDGKVDKKIAEMSLNASSAYQASLKQAYISAVDHSYRGYIFQHEHALDFMDRTISETVTYCHELFTSATKRTEFRTEAMAFSA